MLARLSVQLPFALSVPEGESFAIYEYELDGYQVRSMPPQRSSLADRYSDADEVHLDERKAFNADVAIFEFRKEVINRRRDTEMEPSHELMSKVLNDFLMRLRFVTKSSLVKLLPFPQVTWRVDYLADDGSALPVEEGLSPGRGGMKYDFPFTALNSQIWEAVHTLEPFQPLPGWRNLLLEALEVLPNIGPSIVLTFTALEVFVSRLHDDLAERGRTDKKLWAWLTDRKNSGARAPRIEERFDFLNDLLLGKSLKSDHRLWEQFQKLRKARNAFAHGGTATIEGQPVTEEQAKAFIHSAGEIIEFMKRELPEDMLWPDFNFEIKLTVAKTLSVQRKDDSATQE
jgi:hypothetical protein